MSKAILRDPERARPWQRAPLRSAASTACLSVLADLTGAPGPEESPVTASSHPAEILRRARQEAEQLLEQARREADQLRAAAAQAGFADGQTRAMDEWAGERQRLRELLAHTGEAYRRFCLDQAPALAALASEAAEKLLYEQLSLEPQRAITLVRQALDEVHAAASITLRLNPEDLEMVRGDLIAGNPRRRPAIQLAPDPAVERGGCWIESEHGEVDATVAGRVARLKAVMDG